MNTTTMKTKGLRNIWQSLPVSRKILGGFSAVLVILIAVSVIGVTSFMRAGTEVELFSETVEDAGRIAEIEREFLKMRLHVADYLEFARPEDGEAANKYAEQIAGQITAAREAFTSHGQSTAGLDVIEKDFQIFIKDFERAEYLSLDFRHLMKDKLVPDGDKLEADLMKIVTDLQSTEGENVTTRAALALNHAVRARLYTSIAVGREDATMVDLANAELTKLRAAVEGLSQEVRSAQDRQLLSDVLAIIEEYQGLTAKILAEKSEIHGLVEGEMREMAQELTSEAEQILSNAVAREQAIKKETNALILAAEIEMIAVAIGGVLVGIVLALFIGRQLSRPITGMTDAMTELAGGNLDIEVIGQDRDDEIGRMAKAVQVFKDNAIEKQRLEAEQKEAEARAEAEKKALMNKMADDFDLAVGGIITQVTGASTEMNATASQMSSTATQTTQQTMLVSAAAEQASANVQTVAAATEELTTSISEINQQVTTSTEIVRSAAQSAQTTRKTVEELSEAATAVGEVIELINDIANQTNLLALNATIEAARAGEAGKGFAVVATEVKNLADQTAKATGEIGQRIDTIQLSTEDAVLAMKGIGETIEKVNEISSAIAAAVEEQGVATQEIARNVQEAAQGTEEVTQNIQQVSQGATDTGAASDEVLSASTELSQQSEHLKSEVDKFLETIRAA